MLICEVKVVAEMHEHKAEMAHQSDAFIALPGGYGTMEETLEMVTWSELGIYNKPLVAIMLAIFDSDVEEGFIKPGARHIVVFAVNAKDLLIRMEMKFFSKDGIAGDRVVTLLITQNEYFGLGAYLRFTFIVNMGERSYSYSPEPCGYDQRGRSPSPRGHYGGHRRDLPTSLLVRNLPRDCSFL